MKHPGAFREFLTLPVRNLREIPKSIPTGHAVFIEPVAAACEILEQVKIPCNQPIAVLGDGKLGLLVSQVLQAHGARVHLYGRHREKMRLVEPSGVTTEVAPKKLPERTWPMVVDNENRDIGSWRGHASPLVCAAGGVSGRCWLEVLPTGNVPVTLHPPAGVAAAASVPPQWEMRSRMPATP